MYRIVRETFKDDWFGVGISRNKTRCVTHTGAKLDRKEAFPMYGCRTQCNDSQRLQTHPG